MPIMNQSILTLPLRRKRDTLLARQRARQIARLLGFDAREQTTIATAVFEMARAAFGDALHFQVDRARLRISLARVGVGTQVEKPLPDEAAVAAEDLVWVAQELARCTPPNLFEEFRQQNLETLRLLQEVQALQEELRQLRPGTERSHAA
jgi:hypothetical protein